MCELCAPVYPNPQVGYLTELHHILFITVDTVQNWFPSISMLALTESRWVGREGIMGRCESWLEESGSGVRRWCDSLPPILKKSSDLA